MSQYFALGVDMTLFQWSLEVVRSDLGVENITSKVSLYPPTVSFTMRVSFFWGKISQTIWLHVTLEPWGIWYLWVKKQVLVTWIFPSTWKRRPISLGMNLLHFSLSGIFIRCKYSWVFPVSGQMNTFTITVCKVRLAVAW